MILSSSNILHKLNSKQGNRDLFKVKLLNFFHCAVGTGTSYRYSCLQCPHLSGGGIPDAAAIHAARKKRELMRAKGGKEEFIPLKVAKAPEEIKKMGKRLVREEDEEEEVSVFPVNLFILEIGTYR